MNIYTDLPKSLQLDLTTNKHVLAVDGLFAGFSFTGTLQIFGFVQTEKIDDWLLMLAIATLILATLLFALRINIAMRVISCIYSAADHVLLKKETRYKNLLATGRRIELTGIFSFWISLVPISFHFGITMGIITAIILVCAWIVYFLIIRSWNEINQSVPQIME